ncbi:MAG TPA: LEA type 2 family protein [Steroidobacteraceae bacterium]|nr:LEA type 2 family protein [Steroidobacteraceae bacterium]
MTVCAGCASLQQHDPVQVMVAGIQPLQGEGMELRMLVKLRVQNPNDTPIEYNGVALQMKVQGKTFATGVSDAYGSVPRFGETVIEVPLTVSAFRMARQVFGLMGDTSAPTKLAYEMTGKLNGPGFRAVRFRETGDFALPAAKQE